MDILTLTDKLQGWRSARKIDENSTAAAQINCYNEELHEFKDAIGDMVVCLLNAFAMGAGAHQINQELSRVRAAASAMAVDFDECLQIAWGEIEHRVGLTRDTGKFTKWADLTHAERLIVAEEGQLISAPADTVRDCQKYCTQDQWAEVKAAEKSANDS